MCLGSCVGSCAGSCIAQSCGCTPTGRKGSLVPYVFIMLAAVTLAIILRYSGAESFQHLYWDNFGSCKTTRCIGYGNVFRVSFATFVFFVTHAILLLFKSCWSVDRFSWVGKVLYWLALLVVAYLLPEQFYADFYVHVSRVVAGFFLLLQIVMLVDLAHSTNEKLNELAVGDKETLYKVVIIVLSLLCLIASGVGLGLFYHYFGGSDCKLNQFFISFTLCGTFLILVLCVSEKFSEKGGLLPASVVTLYCYWLCYSGLSSDPSSCNTVGRDQETTQLILGLIVATASIGWAGWSTGTHKSLFGADAEAAAKSIEDKASSEVELGVIDGDRDAAHARAMKAEGGEPTVEEGLVAKRNFKFHCIMAACAMYMAMLLTNWGSNNIATEIEANDDGLSGQAYDLSKESMWIKFVSQWVTMLLFSWSVVAPVVCTGRDFS